MGLIAIKGRAKREALVDILMRCEEERILIIDSHGDLEIIEQKYSGGQMLGAYNTVRTHKIEVK